VVKELRKAFNALAPGPFIRGIIHYPGIPLCCSKGNERFICHLGTQEQQEFPPVTVSLLEETVNGVLSSLERIVPGMEKAGEAFSSKS